jgi:hypothetical protein
VVVAAFIWCPKLIFTMFIYHGNLLVQATKDNGLAGQFGLPSPLTTANGLSVTVYVEGDGLVQGMQTCVHRCPAISVLPQYLVPCIEDEMNKRIDMAEQSWFGNNDQLWG